MDQRPIRILLVEDNPRDARLLRMILGDAETVTFELQEAARLEEGLALLERGAFDVLLLDLMLPDSQGIETVRRARACAPYIPIVVLTAFSDDAHAVQAVQAGAQDYLIKGSVETDLLVRSIRYAIERQRMLAELEQARRKEHFVATHDLLTGLPNRQLFQERLRSAIAEARERGEQLAVLFLDLDRFKVTNDTFGHPTGDCLLQAVARRLDGCLAEGDTAARLGGDEFTIIRQRLQTPAAAAALAERILDLLSQPFRVEATELFITASIGISLYPDDGMELDTLVKNADTAMYRAKSGGRNRYQFYHPRMSERAREQMELETSLHSALERREFLLHYQPQIEVSSGRVIGFEALLRWNHPRLGLLRPTEFISLAEETGLIGPIGEWVVREACAQNRAWQSQGLPPVTVAVNLSGRQFQQQDPVRTVIRALEDTRLAPRFLELELTESVVMQDPDRAVAALQDLKRVGVRISIDDFGTGYSSLSYLSRFPLEKLKIDREFVRTITLNPTNQAITSAIVALAQSLQLKPIAEGVETREQLETLRSLNCEFVQGFLVSRPLTAGAAGRFLQAGYSLDQLLRRVPSDDMSREVSRLARRDASLVTAGNTPDLEPETAGTLRGSRRR